MAWVFELSTECGSEERAERFGRFLSGLALSLTDGTRVAVALEPLDPVSDADTGWWRRVIFGGANRNDPEADEAHLAEAARLLYRRLSVAPPFRISTPDCDVCQTYSGFMECPDLPSGTVLDVATWDAVGRPSGFSVFGDGTVWIPHPCFPSSGI